MDRVCLVAKQRNGDALCIDDIQSVELVSFTIAELIYSFSLNDKSGSSPLSGRDRPFVDEQHVCLRIFRIPRLHISLHRNTLIRIVRIVDIRLISRRISLIIERGTCQQYCVSIFRLNGIVLIIDEEILVVDRSSRIIIRHSNWGAGSIRCVRSRKHRSNRAFGGSIGKAERLNCNQLMISNTINIVCRCQVAKVYARKVADHHNRIRELLQCLCRRDPGFLSIYYSFLRLNAIRQNDFLPITIIIRL